MAHLKLLYFESALKSDKFILLAHGTAAEVATDIMQATHPTELALHGIERQVSATEARASGSYKVILV